MTVSTAGGSTVFSNSNAKTSGPSTGLDAASFMQLFTTQLANQNPMEPMNSADFLNQFAQITSVQTMNDLSKTLGDVKNSMNSLKAATQFAQAEGLLGRNISYIDSIGALKQDRVDAFRVNMSGDVQFSVDGLNAFLNSQESEATSFGD